jgi:hypothetical protein
MHSNFHLQESLTNERIKARLTEANRFRLAQAGRTPFLVRRRRAFLAAIMAFVRFW